MPALSVSNLTFRRGKRHVLTDVSFEVEQGETVSVIGPNGAGKTTLLKCLLRMLAADAGEVRLMDRPLGSLCQKELARLVAYVPQAEEIAAPFTVEEFVLLARFPHLSPFSTLRQEDRTAARKALELTDLTPLAARRMDAISGGERQRAYFAAALAQGSPILFLDEPTAFLDYRHQDDIRDILVRARRAAPLSVLSVTHDVNRAAVESDRILALSEGRIVFDGKPETLMQTGVLESIYGGSFVTTPHPETGLPMVVPRASVDSRAGSGEEVT